MEKFDSFEKCCQALGLDPENCLPDVSKVPQHHQEAITSLTKLVIISEAVNDGWKPNWDDSNEEKWLPWFDMEVDSNNPSGFRFIVSRFGRTTSNSAGGSRLCFETEEQSDFVGKHYEDLWRAAMVLLK